MNRQSDIESLRKNLKSVGFYGDIKEVWKDGEVVSLVVSQTLLKNFDYHTEGIEFSVFKKQA